MDGNALVLCEGAFGTLNGKTAHGLVRFTNRYKILGVIDSTHAGRDAGEILDGKPCGIPIYANLAAALAVHHGKVEYFVIGLAPDGGMLPASYHSIIAEAIHAGLNIDSGLHEFLSDEPEFRMLAQKHGVQIRDVRKPPVRKDLHFFSGKINDVKSIRIAVLGTDSAVGKRTTAWKVTQALNEAGIKTEMIGTGQTAWMQGAKFGVILDSLINDFVSGEIEHAIWSCWNEERPQVMLLEGQGSLMHPAYPGGFELLAAGRPHAVILQTAPKRKTYDGFPDFPMAPLEKEIQVVELLSNRPVIALTLNHENMTEAEITATTEEYEKRYGIPCCDILKNGAEKVVRKVLAAFSELKWQTTASF
ncbi:MAG: DUF1611 domain-containing protein [candidate division KSB1 bacterium]|nr:DUF1611 domain-containing protein [candidate division KSB1 bacterium]